MRQEYEPRGVGVLAVSLSSNRDEVPSYARRHGFNGPVAYFRSDDGLFELELGSVPATYFVNAEGKVVGVARGGRSRRFFARQAEALLQGGNDETPER